MGISSIGCFSLMDRAALSAHGQHSKCDQSKRDSSSGVVSTNASTNSILDLLEQVPSSTRSCGETVHDIIFHF